MKVLALEPWYGGSHKTFLDGLIGHSRHEFGKITMAARFWKWRMHGGAVTMARKAEQFAEKGERPDVIFASDYVNLPAFLALTRRCLSDIPVVLYMHENQLTYPLPDGKERDNTYAYINYLACLSADHILFNSQFHYDTFMEALPRLLRMFPDYTHLNTVRKIRDRCSVAHLGMNLQGHDRYASAFEQHNWGPGMKPPIVLWNQRWEYDKDPEAFFRLMNRLDDAGYSFRLILAGEHFEEQPHEFEKAFERYAERILHYGYAEDFAEYSRLLHRADIVISTSVHEFFGISIQEAIYCGCHPLLPNRLSYPELIPESLHRPLLHAPVLYEDGEELFRIMTSILSGDERPLPLSTLKGICEHLEWSKQVKVYDDVLEEVASSRMAEVLA